MNPEETKEVQQLQELLTKFNSETSYIRVENVKIFESGEEGEYVGKLEIADDNETMLFTQNKRK